MANIRVRVLLEDYLLYLNGFEIIRIYLDSKFSNFRIFEFPDASASIESSKDRRLIIIVKQIRIANSSEPCEPSKLTMASSLDVYGS